MLSGSGSCRSGVRAIMRYCALLLTLCGLLAAPASAETDPDAPTGVTVTPQNKGLSVAWTPIPGATYVLQYRKKLLELDWDDNENVGLIDDINNPGTSVAGLDNNVTYELRVGIKEGTTNRHWSDTVTGKPFAPVSGLVLIPGDETIKADWTDAPSTVDHVLQYREKSAANWTEVTKVNSYRRLEGLTNGTVYEVRVGAILEGVTQWSAIAAASPLGLPMGIEIGSGDSTLKVSWTDGPGAASHSVRYRKAGAGAWAVVETAANPQTLSSLENDAIYDVQVGAVAEGLTRWSETVQQAPNPAPSGVTAVSLVCGVKLDWTNAAGADRYIARYRTAATMPWLEQELDSNPAPLVNLRSNQGYQVRVGARFEGADQTSHVAWSDTVSVTTKTVTAVTGLSASPANAGLVVAWTQEATNAGTHLVRVSKKIRAGEYDEGETSLAFSQPVTIPDLDNDDAYQVAVTPACDGAEAWSTLGNDVTPSTLEVTPGNTQLAVTWPGAETSLQYREAGNPPKTWMPVTGLSGSHTIPSLTNGTTYEVQIGDSAQSTWSTSVKGTPFGPPTDVSVRPEEFAATVAFTRDTTADTGGAHVLEWRVKDSGSPWNRVHQTSGADHRLANLVNGTTYEMRVASVLNGVVQWARADDGTILTVTGTPFGSPAITEILKTAGSGAEVHYTAGEGASSHSVRYRQMGTTTTWTEEEVTDNPHTISGLGINVSYNIQVGAKTEGDVRWNSTSFTKTPGNAPTITQITGHPCGLHVNWQAVTNANNKVRFERTGKSDGWTETTIGITKIVAGLRSGTEYDVQIGSQIGNGQLTWSETVKGTTLAAVKATNVAVESLSSGLQVTWDTEPSMDSYSLRHRERMPVGSWTTRSSALTGKGTQKIDGLTNGTEYDVQVGAACLDDMATLWTDSVMQTPYGPAGVTLTTGDGGMKVAWTPSPGADSHHIRYRIHSPVIEWITKAPEHHVVSSGSEVVFSNLESGTRYEVQVGAKHGTEIYWSNAVSIRVTDKPSITSVEPEDGALRVLINPVPVPNRQDIHYLEYRKASTTDPNPNMWKEVLAGEYEFRLGRDLLGRTQALENGTSYELRMRADLAANNKIYSDIVTAIPFAKPADLFVITGSQSAQASWTAADGAESYTLRYRKHGVSEWTTETGIATTTKEITGLDTNGRYTVQVSSVAGGVTQWLDSTFDIRVGQAPPTPTLTPLACGFEVVSSQIIGTQDYPMDVRIVNADNTKGAWTSTNIKPVSGGALQGVAVGLKQNHLYEVRVGAKFPGATTSWSGITQGTTGAGRGPADVSVTPGETTLTAAWTRVQGVDHEYLRYQETGSSSWNIEMFNVGSPFEITGLTAGTTYDVQVGSVCDPGVGNEEYWSDTVTATPGGVGSVAVAPGDQKLTVSWTGGSHAASYSVRRSTDSGVTWTTDTNATSPHEITGLANGTAYDVQVGAVITGVTEPRWSPTVAGTPAAGAGGMGAPMGFSARSGDRAVSLSWQMPAEPEEEQPSANTVKGFSNTLRIKSSSGRIRSMSDAPPAPPTSYEVGYTVEGAGWSEGGSQTVSDMAASISGLENGTSYAFRVRAKSGEETGAWSKTVVATPEAETANRPTGVTGATTAETAWKTMDLSFNAPAEGTDWVAANSQYRLRSMKEGANRTPWRALQNVSVADGKVTASTGSYLAVGRIFELEVRWCKETVSDATCSEASDMVHGASPASAPETAQASAADPASQTALALAWSIANTGGKKNMHAAYEIGWSADSAATTPETLLDTVPAFGETAAEIGGLAAGTAYRLFVRSVIDHEGARLFASAWASATAATEGAPALALGAGPADPAWVAGTAIAALVLPEATGGSGAVTYALAPASWNGITLDTATRTLSGTPAAAGSQAFTWTATDAAGASDSLTFTATVTASDTVAPTAALALADGVETPAVAPFSITVTFSEAVTGFALDDLTVAHGAASALAGSGASYSATITPEEGYAGNLTVDVAAGAAQDAAGNASMAAETLTVAVVPPVTKPTGVAPNTTAATSWKTLDLSFDAPPAYTGWTAAQSQYRVRSVKEGANRTPWRALQNVSVADGTASASTGSYLAIGRVFEVELRYCGETISDAACSGASDMVYGASPASAPENAQASATEPASQTALTLSWSIANIGGKKNMHAAYEIGWSADTGATAPETLLTTVPDFGETEAEVGGLEAGGGYRLFVRSVIDWQGARLFASNWASVVGTTAASANGLANRMLKQVLVVKARRLLEDASDVIGRRMADGGPGNDAFSAFAGLFGGQGPGGCTLAESIEDCVTRGASGGGGLGFGPGDRFGGGSHAGFGGSGADGGAETRSFSLSDLRGLLKSRGFAVSLNRPLPRAGAQFSQDASVPDEGMQLTLWGQGAAGGADSAMFWGMDASGAGWMTGVAFAESGHSVSSALSAGGGRMSGFAESAVTAVYPYAKGRFASGLELWSLAGWGTGRVDSSWTGFASASGPEERIDLDGGLGFSLGMMGAEQVLYEAGGLSLSAVGDAGWSRLAASGGTADGVSAAVHRTRFAVSGRYEAGGLTSSLRLGGRMDGGDGETASGAEVSGDMRHAWGRWEAGAQGRWYTAETTGAGFGEQGVRAALGLRAREDGTGLAFALSPGWGTEAGALHGGGLLGALDGDAGAAARSPAAHLDGRVSWGARIPGLVAGPELLRPWAAFSLSGGASRHFRTGLALEGPIRMNLALERRESTTGPAEHGIMLRIDTRF